jgi:hypothetical protein
MAEKYRRPTPKSQRELSKEIANSLFMLRREILMMQLHNKQFPPENEANIPFNRSTQMSFKNDYY